MSFKIGILGGGLQGTEAACEPPPAVNLRPGRACTIYRPGGEQVCTARVSGCENNEVLLHVDPSWPVRPGGCEPLTAPSTCG